MNIIDPHSHMISRTTDDYMALASSGIHTITEPSFWPGFNRGSCDNFRAYYHQLAVSEPLRAARFGIRHYCWIGLNSSEAEDLILAYEVLGLFKDYLSLPTVLGLGEIGLNKNSRNELTVFEKQVDMAVAGDELILVHTSRLEDKFKGTRLIMDILLNEPRIDPGRVLIDHDEAHTLREILDNGFWAGLTFYPDSKGSPQRAVDAIEMLGCKRVCINYPADWSVTDPLATVKTVNEMRRRGHSPALINQVFYDNPRSFLSQCPKFHASC